MCVPALRREQAADVTPTQLQKPQDQLIRYLLVVVGLTGPSLARESGKMMRISLTWTEADVLLRQNILNVQI